jgi:GalNAc-alpha-(1->4)-GalNAc-alpha-(1->3)-diNAcBac-PP-undecaprenol alpha-1,4-N-acetyl-D-galactosaminyltransferase
MRGWDYSEAAKSAVMPRARSANEWNPFLRSARRITFVISSLTSGGAERVMSTMANAWAEAGNAVTIITLTARSVEPFYPLDPAVSRIGLGRARPSPTPAHAALGNVTRVKALRTAIRSSRPDVIISFLDTTNVLTLLATRGIKVPVVVAEHTDPGLKHLHPAWSRLRAWTYPWAARLVVLSESSKAFFPDKIRRNTVIIPNPVAIDPPHGPVEKPMRPLVAAMGRFGPEKGFDMLIDAFAMIAPQLPDWDLVIWGEGDLRPELTAHRDRLGLTERIHFPGRTTAPHDELRKAEIFVLSSRREGFPMVLAEAMACGLPGVAFNISSGIPDILRDHHDGLLVPSGDTRALAKSLASLMTDDRRRADMARNAPDVLERYGVATVMSVWNQLIEDVSRDV